MRPNYLVIVALAAAISPAHSLWPFPDNDKLPPGSMECDATCRKRIIYSNAYSSASSAATLFMDAWGSWDWCMSGDQRSWCEPAIESMVNSIATELSTDSADIVMDDNCDDVCLLHNLAKSSSIAGYWAMDWAANYVRGPSVPDKQTRDALQRVFSELSIIPEVSSINAMALEEAMKKKNADDLTTEEGYTEFKKQDRSEIAYSAVRLLGTFMRKKDAGLDHQDIVLGRSAKYLRRLLNAATIDEVWTGAGSHSKRGIASPCTWFVRLLRGLRRKSRHQNKGKGPTRNEVAVDTDFGKYYQMRNVPMPGNSAQRLILDDLPPPRADSGIVHTPTNANRVHFEYKSSRNLPRRYGRRQTTFDHTGDPKTPAVDAVPEGQVFREEQYSPSTGQMRTKFLRLADGSKRHLPINMKKHSNFVQDAFLMEEIDAAGNLVPFKKSPSLQKGAGSKDPRYTWKTRQDLVRVDNAYWRALDARHDVIRNQQTRTLRRQDGVQDLNSLREPVFASFAKDCPSDLSAEPSNRKRDLQDELMLSKRTPGKDCGGTLHFVEVAGRTGADLFFRLQDDSGKAIKHDGWQIFSWLIPRPGNKSPKPDIDVIKEKKMNKRIDEDEKARKVKHDDNKKARENKQQEDKKAKEKKEKDERRARKKKETEDKQAREKKEKDEKQAKEKKEKDEKRAKEKKEKEAREKKEKDEKQAKEKKAKDEKRAKEQKAKEAKAAANQKKCEELAKKGKTVKGGQCPTAPSPPPSRPSPSPSPPVEEPEVVKTVMPTPVVAAIVNTSPTASSSPITSRTQNSTGTHHSVATTLLKFVAPVNATSSHWNNSTLTDTLSLNSDLRRVNSTLERDAAGSRAVRAYKARSARTISIS